jgi:LysM repeat protein
LAESQTFTTSSGWDGTASPIPTGAPNPDANTYGSLQLQSEVLYQGPNGTSGYDADGDVVAYQYRGNTGRVDQYQVNYLKKDTYLQGDTTGDSNETNVLPATDQSIYNTRGNEVALEQHTEDPYGNIADTVHVFAYNGAGEIIEREDGTGSSGTSLNLGSTPAKEVQHYAYVSGQQLAHFDDAGTLDVLDQVTAFSSNNDSPNSYVVQAGDTLESIAQTEYGNANLWYVLAQANDLSSDTNLALGQRLQIPAVTTHANSAVTFKPYDPSSIIGSTTPNLPTLAPPPPAMHNNCSWLAQLISVVVTVIVTVFSKNPIAGAAAGNASGQVSQAMLNGTFDWGRYFRHTMDPFEGSHAGLGKTILGQIEPSYGGTEFWTSKSGGSDLDIAIWNPPEAGMKGQFDRQGTLIAAGVGAVTWGANQYLSPFLAAGVTYAANAGLNEAFGRPADFSLGGLAATMLSAEAGAEVGASLGENTQGITLSSALARTADYAVRDVVDRELSIAFGDQHVPSWTQVGVDVAGNALGMGAVLGIRSYQEQQAQQQQQAFAARMQQGINDSVAQTSELVDGQIANDVQASAYAQLSDKVDQLTQAKLDSSFTLSNPDGVQGTSDAFTLSTSSSANGDGSASTAGGKPGQGFAVWRPDQIDPSNPADRAKLQQEYDDIKQFLAGQNYVVSGKPYSNPPTEPTALMNYGLQLSKDYWEPIHEAQQMQNLAITVTPTGDLPKNSNTPLTDAQIDAFTNQQAWELVMAPLHAAIGAGKDIASDISYAFQSRARFDGLLQASLNWNVAHIVGNAADRKQADIDLATAKTLMKEPMDKLFELNDVERAGSQAVGLMGASELLLKGPEVVMGLRSAFTAGRGVTDVSEAAASASDLTETSNVLDEIGGNTAQGNTIIDEALTQAPANVGPVTSADNAVLADNGVANEWRSSGELGGGNRPGYMDSLGEASDFATAGKVGNADEVIRASEQIRVNEIRSAHSSTVDVLQDVLRSPDQLANTIETVGSATEVVRPPTGAFAGDSVGGTGFGKLEGRSLQITAKGMDIVEAHLRMFSEAYGPDVANNVMVGRLRQAISNGTSASGADAVFYTHELTEATIMKRTLANLGLDYNSENVIANYYEIHNATLAKYGVSPWSVYHPDAIAAADALAGTRTMNPKYYAFWGVE